MPNDKLNCVLECDGNNSNEEIIDYGVHMLSAYQDEIEQLTFTNTNLNRTLEYLKSEASESENCLKSEINLLKEENKKLKEISSEIDILREQCNLLKLQCQTRDEELQELQEYIDQLQVSLKLLKDDIKTKDAVISVLRHAKETNEDIDERRVVTSKLKYSKAKSVKQIVNIPTENRYSTLDLVHSDSDHVVVRSNILPKQFPSRPKFEMATKINHRPLPIVTKSDGLNTVKISILGDSHARGLAAMLSHMVNDCNAVIEGYVKPSASFECVISSFSSCKESDVLVLLGGSNDIYNGNGDHFLHQLESFLQGRLQENYTKPILVGNIPFRHDLHSNHKINTCIFDMNTKLNKLRSKFHNLGINVVILDMYGIPRNCQTFHGQHLNRRGKRVLCSLIKNFLGSQTLNSLCIRETLNLATDSDTDTMIDVILDHKSPVSSPTFGFNTPDNSKLNRQCKAISKFCETSIETNVQPMVLSCELSPNVSSTLPLSPAVGSEKDELSTKTSGVNVTPPVLLPLLGSGTPQMLNTVTDKQIRNNDSKVVRPSKYFLRTAGSKPVQR